MKMVIQRVKKAAVSVENSIIGQIEQGYMILLGVSNNDTKEIADKMVRKLLNLRIFEDENGKTNLDIRQVDGEVLLVSQFTLYADCKKGNRPSFIKAGSPNEANKLYQYMIEQCTKELPQKTSCGSFGADMKVSILNDGPFTIMLDSDEIL